MVAILCAPTGLSTQRYTQVSTAAKVFVNPVQNRVTANTMNRKLTLANMSPITLCYIMLRWLLHQCVSASGVLFSIEECLYNTEQQLFKRLRAFCLRPNLTRANLQVCCMRMSAVSPHISTMQCHLFYRSHLTDSNGGHSSCNINTPCTSRYTRNLCKQMCRVPCTCT